MNQGIPRTLALKALRTYKGIVSPWLPHACRFTPTCAEYAFEAIEQYGFIQGFSRACARLLRCHPLHRGGFDPLT
jgi:putative membrane protein insertion efficiency factor